MTVLSRLLGALCRCICDPQLNAASQEIRPAESLGQLLLFHLNSKSALQRITVALVLCEWAALQKVKSSDVKMFFIGSLLSLFSYFIELDSLFSYFSFPYLHPVGLSGGVSHGAATSPCHPVGALVL